MVIEAGLIGLAVGLLVVAPWTRSGYLLLLDWVSGPQQALNPGVYGLSGGALDAMPFRLGSQALRVVVGPAVAAWLTVLAYFPIAAAGAAHLSGGTRWRRHTAALLMVANPFVVDRVRAGHVIFLLGLALLPWLLRSALHARADGRWVAVRPAGWYALAMAIVPHLFWIGGVALVVVAVLPRPTWRDAVRTLQIGVSATLVYAYGITVWLTGIRTIAVTDADLDAYATVPGPGGLLTTLLSLHGFWRDFPDQARTSLPLAVAVAVLLVGVALVVVGLTRLVVVDVTAGAPLVALAAVGLLLASGVAGPIAPLYRWAFDRVPLFEAMREQQKWLALTVVAAAVATGAAVEWLRQDLPRTVGHHLPAWAPPTAAGVAAAVIPLACAPSLLWGLGGTVSTSEYPAGWYEADAAMGTGQDLALFLPWHGYQPFDFTDGRSVATPAEAFFRRGVLSSDAVELKRLRTNSVSRRTAYLDRLVADAGGGTSFGRMLAPLGVRYVVLSTERESDRYVWLDRQSDLRLVQSSESVRLYEVVGEGTGRVVSARVVAGLERALVLAAEGSLGTEAVLTDAVDLGGAQEQGPIPSTASGGLRRASRTMWAVEPGTPGWVVVPEEWAPGWRVGDTPGVPTLAGTVALPVGADPVQVEYVPWRWLRLGVLLSLLSLLSLLVLGLVEHSAEVRALLRHRHAEASTRPRATA